MAMVIKNRMDLGTIRSKLKSNSYSSPYEFAADVRLTFDNALEFNPEGDPVNDMAKTLSKIFESKWKAIEKKKRDVGVKRRLKEEEEEGEEEDDKSLARVFGKRKAGKEMPEWSTDVPEPIVEFVKKHRTDLSPDEEENEDEDDDDEMQLDMNMLHNNKLWELYELVTVCMDRKPNVDTAGGAVTTGATERDGEEKRRTTTVAFLHGKCLEVKNGSDQLMVLTSLLVGLEKGTTATVALIMLPIHMQSHHHHILQRASERAEANGSGKLQIVCARKVDLDAERLTAREEEGIRQILLSCRRDRVSFLPPKANVSKYLLIMLILVLCV